MDAANDSTSLDTSGRSGPPAADRPSAHWHAAVTAPRSVPGIAASHIARKVRVRLHVRLRPAGTDGAVRDAVCADRAADVARSSVLLTAARRAVRTGVHDLQAADDVPPVRASHGA